MFNVNREKLKYNKHGKMIRKCQCCGKRKDCRPLIEVVHGRTVNVCALCAFLGLATSINTGGGLVGRMTRDMFARAGG